MQVSRWVVGPVWGAVALSCVEAVTVDPSETGSALALGAAPVADFDPAQSIVPLPNALLMSPVTGRVNVPPSCGETPDSAAARLRATLNQLDGFGTSQANLVATFSEPVDAASLEGRVFLVRLAERGVPLPRFEGPVAVDLVPGSSTRFAADCQSSSQVPNLALRPRAPLVGSSTYAVLLVDGIVSESGGTMQATPSWGLVRQSEPPVVFAEAGNSAEDLLYNATPFDPSTPEGLASLQGLDQLWRGHAPLLAALDQLTPLLLGRPLPREGMLLAWAFATQTLGDPLDASIAGSPANQLTESPAPLSIAAPLAGTGGPLTVEQFFATVLPGVPCSALGCDAIGAIYSGSPLSAAPTFTSTSFLQGDDCSLPAASAGAFDDPIQPSAVCQRELPLLIVVPQTPAPASGYPTLLFAHGLTRSKEDLLAIAGALAQGGIASVAMDAVDHGVRAFQVSTEAALGCAGAGPGLPCETTFGPTCAPQCFASILSSDLAASRDHLRQTMLDQLTLEAVLQGCAAAGACGALQLDPAQLGYLGQSLGALIGGVSVAMSEGLRTAAFNVGAADWLRILTDTSTPAISCPLVDALIASGVLSGEPWNLGTNPDALCLGDSWKTDPGFLQFASAARWILDPADPINYASRYGESRSVLLAEVIGDAVIPNSATREFGEALGLTAEPASISASLPPPPSLPVLTAGSHWLEYHGLDANLPLGFPGNAYSHGSLLAPATPSASMAPGSGELGTLRLQADTVGFFATHLGSNP